MLPEAVKYVPYYFTLGLSEVEEDGFSLFNYEITDLPDWLEVDRETNEIYGVPMSSGTYEFSVDYEYALVEEFAGGSFTVLYSLTVLDNSNSNVQRPNDYDIDKNVGTEDPNSPNRYLLTEYSDEDFVINGPYLEFYRLYIDGVERIKGVDYSVREGSTVITIFEQTFRSVGEGTHTIAAEFRGTDADGKTSVKQVAQNYTLTISRPSSSGGGSSGGGGAAASASYGITVPSIPNCTITVSPTSASANAQVTLTVRPDAGYTLTALTVTGPNGEEITLIPAGEYEYAFIMPNGKVDIAA